VFTIYAPQTLTIANISTTPMEPLPDGDYQTFAAITTYADNFNCQPPAPASGGCYASKFVIWSSTNPTAVSINNVADGSPGLARSLMPAGNSSVIDCKLPGLGAANPDIPCGNPQTVNTGDPVLSFVVVTPRNQRIATLGNHLTFVANGHYSNTQDAPNNVHASPFGSDTVTWASSDQTVATISNTAGATF